FVHAEDFLEDHQSRPAAARRQGEIALEFAAILGGDVDEFSGHVSSPIANKPTTAGSSSVEIRGPTLSAVNCDFNFKVGLNFISRYIGPGKERHHEPNQSQAR